MQVQSLCIKILDDTANLSTSTRTQIHKLMHAAEQVMVNNVIYCNLNASLMHQNSEKESRQCRKNVQLGKARMMSWNDIEDA